MCRCPSCRRHLAVPLAEAVRILSTSEAAAQRSHAAPLPTCTSVRGARSTPSCCSCSCCSCSSCFGSPAAFSTTTPMSAPAAPEPAAATISLRKRSTSPLRMPKSAARCPVPVSRQSDVRITVYGLTVPSGALPYTVTDDCPAVRWCALSHGLAAAGTSQPTLYVVKSPAASPPPPAAVPPLPAAGPLPLTLPPPASPAACALPGATPPLLSPLLLLPLPPSPPLPTPPPVPLRPPAPFRARPSCPGPPPPPLARPPAPPAGTFWR